MQDVSRGEKQDLPGGEDNSGRHYGQAVPRLHLDQQVWLQDLCCLRWCSLLICVGDLFSTIKTYFQMINPQSSAYISEQLWVLLTGQKWNGAVLLQPPWPTGKYLLFMQRSSSKSHICSFTRLTPEEVAALQVQFINDWIKGDDALCLDQILQGREWSIVPPVYTYCRFCQVIFSLWRMPPSNREWCRIPVIVMYTHCRFCHVIVSP